MLKNQKKTLVEVFRMVMLKNYIESFTYFDDLPRNERIEVGRKELFDFDYPFYDETKRTEFETRFIKHFYMREVGSEVIGLFKFRLEDYLNLNMPYWNKMFETEELNFPVFEDFDYTVTGNESKDVNSQTGTDSIREGTSKRGQNITDNENKKSDTSANTNENNFHRNLYTDTPQSDLKIAANGNGTGVISHASSIEEDNNLNKSDTTGTQTEVNTRNQKSDSDLTENEKQGMNTDKKQQEKANQERAYKGKKGNTDYADLLKKYRSTMVRIERMIFDEINKEGLFLLVYGGR